MPAQSPVRGRMALIAASLAGLLLLFVLGTVFSSGPVIEAGGTVPAARVEISEYMTSNGSAYPDGNGLFSDWVELHNTTGSRISLAGWALSDGNTTWLLPARTLEADEYLVIFCDGDGKDPLHANFRLKAAGGETLSLKDASGDVEDTTVTIPLQTNVSAVRTTAGFSESAHSTPGYPNTDEGYAAYRATRVGTSDALFLSEILAQNTLTLPDADGAYPDYIEVVNRSDEPAALKGYGLTNDPDEPLKWQFPERTLAPGETVLVFASDKGHSADPEELHAPFKINRSSDTLYLSTPAGVLIDQVEVNGLAADAALLRDAGGAWSVGEPSPVIPIPRKGSAHTRRGWTPSAKARCGSQRSCPATRRSVPSTAAIGWSCRISRMLRSASPASFSPTIRSCPAFFPCPTSPCSRVGGWYFTATKPTCRMPGTARPISASTATAPSICMTRTGGSSTGFPTPACL